MLKLNNNDLKNIEKQSRYIGGEYNQILKDKKHIEIRYAICFPDIYETSFCNISLKSIYNMINNRCDTWCERVFAPGKDFEDLIRKKKIKLYALESKSNLDSFDIINFNIDNEMTYTNVLNMIDLFNIPLYAKDRQIRFPFIIATGNTTVNPYPMSPFIDIFVIGEFEAVINILLDKYKEWKQEKGKKTEYLDSIKNIEGVFIPSLHKTEDIIVSAVTRNVDDEIDYGHEHIVSNILNNKDKIYLEVARKNKYNLSNENIRQNSNEKLLNILKDTYKSTGLNKVCLDFANINNLQNLNNIDDFIIEVTKFSIDNKLKISYKNLKINLENISILKKMNYNLKSSITLDIGAASQKFRNLINPIINETYIINFAKMMFESGFTNLNLKLMIGLPTEDYSDLNYLLELCNKINSEYYKFSKDKIKNKFNLTIITEVFIPRPHTQFQYLKMCSQSKLEMKQEFLKDKLYKKNVKYIYDDVLYKKIKSFLILGDSKISKVIYNSWRFGSRFDNHKENFKYSIWNRALEKENIDLENYFINDKETSFCFDNIDVGIDKKYMIQKFYDIKTKLGI